MSVVVVVVALAWGHRPALRSVYRLGSIYFRFFLVTHLTWVGCSAILHISDEHLQHTAAETRETI